MKQIQHTSESDDRGFTLLELLVTMAIIGILAAIAIPRFLTYRQRGFDARAESDLRNGAVAEEAYYAKNQIYITYANTSACVAALSQFKPSGGSLVSFVDGGTSFTGTASHPLGSELVFSWDSSAGGLQ